MNKFSFKIENDEYIWELKEEEDYSTFMYSLFETLRNMGVIDPNDQLAFLSPDACKILDWAGESY